MAAQVADGAHLVAVWGLPPTMHLFWAVAWAGLVLLFSGIFLTLVFTRKGRANPLRICIVLSLLVHTLLAGYATTIQIVAATFVGEGESIEIEVLPEGALEQAEETERIEQPWERLTTDVVSPDTGDVDRVATAIAGLPRMTPREDASSTSLPLPSVDLEEVSPNLPQATAAVDDSLNGETDSAIQAEQIEAPNAAESEAAVAAAPDVQALERVESSSDAAEAALPRDESTSPLLDAASVLPSLADIPAVDAPDEALAGVDDILTSTAQTGPAPLAVMDVALPPNNATESAAATEAANQKNDEELPAAYRHRTDPQRGKVAAQTGGNALAQAAVDSGLAWLASAQGKDGRWDCDYWGGGRELNIAGSDRRGAGAQADTGISGLSILAFLGAGHTHQRGDYQATVARGLTFLMRSQRSDGNLAGDATLFARMYCHGMASFALSEAYAMTGDERLRPAVQQAINYIVAAQDSRGGGWRYQPGDAGDTSQLGWQVMALKSAELAGIDVPAKTRTGIERFLRSVSSGHRGGLASYQPGRPANVAMTAEALVCRQFVGYATDDLASQEAADYLLTQLPSADRMNLYYYYYATLALHRVQGERWSRWNAALQKTLIETQRIEGVSERGDLTGSWDPNTVWGSHGGRAYSTAIATLSLEVYYRYADDDSGQPDRSARRRGIQRR